MFKDMFRWLIDSSLDIGRRLGPSTLEAMQAASDGQPPLGPGRAITQFKGIQRVLTSDQIRVARALLRWSARQLAGKASVHITTVQRMESGNGPVGGTVQTLAKVQNALEEAGVEFTSQDDGPGVRLKKPRRARDRWKDYFAPLLSGR